ncbi:MAG TPA: hypothetical protein PLN21_20385 [Gemmatales bacterium]|nr:hypothetical protein [Gemmatales bacterium]
MRILTPLLLTCLLAGCNAVGPMPGHLTQNVNAAQMKTMLDQNLKPGMAMTEAESFMKKEEFTYGYMKQHMTGNEAVKYTRKDPIDFWTDQNWTVTLEGSQGKLTSYKLSGEAEKPVMK